MLQFIKIFFLTLFCLCSLQGYGQTIHLKMKEASLKEIANQIEQKSNYTFVFNESLDMKQRKTISIIDKSIAESLDQIFRGTGIDWQIMDTHIILSKANKITISGYVTESGSSETLIGSTITDKQTNINSMSNSYGYYSIEVLPDSVYLQASYIGFIPTTKRFYAKKDTLINFRLQESNTELENVIIYNTESLATAGSTINLSTSEIKSTPATFGETDILRSLQSMPGISSGVEGSTGISVRGGSPDQSLILIDGTPAYNTGHMLNLFSIINGDAVKKVTLYKSYFPARFGGRLASVLDLRLKDGDMKHFRASATIGLYTAHLNVEGPIIKNKTSFNFSARRSYIDSFLRIAARTQDNDVSILYMYDINAKINHKFSDSSRLYLSYYSGRDKQNNKSEYDNTPLLFQLSEEDYSWGNDILSLRWNYVFNSKLFLNASVAYNRYHYNYNSQTINEYENNLKKEEMFRKSGIKDIQSGVDFEYQLNNKHYVRFGGSLIFHQFNPEEYEYRVNQSNIINQNQSLYYFLNQQINGKEASLYIEDEYAISQKLKANYGVHLSLFNVQDKTYLNLQPRVAIGYQLSQKLRINASYSKMSQSINLLSTNVITQPTDIWVPITKDLKPMLSQQIATGLFFEPKNTYSFSIEGFYKKMNNVLDYKDGIAWKDVFTTWDENIEAGKGWAYGIELLAQKKEGRLTGWIGYTLSWNNRRFPTINKGEKFAAKYDSRHNVNITATYRLSKKIDFSASWMYATGIRSTLPVEEYQALPVIGENYYGWYESSINYVDKRNNYKLSDNHHLDIEMKYNYSSKKLWTFGIYNVYNRFNPYTVNINDSRSSIVTEKALFGIMPSISYTYKFR